MTALSLFGRAAVAYAERLDMHVLPLLPRRKEPDGRLVPHGFVEATRHEATIARWWDRAPSANVAVACAVSGVVVIDIDPRSDGEDTFEALESELGHLPRTWTVLTPGGGAHYYLRAAEGTRFVGSLGSGVDVKHCGYVVAPPSVHPNGGVYRWDLGAHPLEVLIAQLPNEWHARMTRPQRRHLRLDVDSHARDSFLGVAFGTLGWLGQPLARGRNMVRCPWLSEHSDGRGDGRDSSTVLFPRAVGATLGAFLCSHAHCAGRDAVRVVRELPPEAIEAASRAFPSAYRTIVWRLASARRRSA